MAGHGQGYYEALKVKKLFEKDLARVLEDVKLWEERRRLAEGAAKPHLVEAAEGKLAELKEDEGRCRGKIAEADKLLAEAALAEGAGPDLTPTDRAELLKGQIDDMVGEESKTGQEADKVSREQKSAEDLERLKKGEADADLADL
ncbi:MAG: hypothetical protein NTW26_05360 [bacterium]|nr:hypothetical protein [bacterium]